MLSAPEWPGPVGHVADRRDRRNRPRTWAAAIAAPVLVVAGLTLAVSGAAVSESRPTTAPSAVLSPESAPEPDSAPAPHRKVVEGPPQLVAVPVLGIRVPVDPIEVEAGALTPPSDPGRIGWWADGARPGARHGKAVLTGHTVNAGGGASTTSRRSRRVRWSSSRRPVAG